MGEQQFATLAGGCFWCLEAVYCDLQGVVSVEPGYSGGAAVSPTYEQVCTGKTGHAESVRICFDPSAVSFRDLLEVFFAIHDPTTLNRQGEDVGTQYRSAIYCHSTEQERTAREVIFELFDHRVFDQPIVTEVLPAGAFHRAEDYHREYFARNPNQPYCAAVVSPKLLKFRQKFAHRLRRA